MKYDVFISYRRKSASERAELLKAIFLQHGYKEDKIFMDTHSLKGGDFKQRITEAIEQSGNIVVLITEKCFDGIRENDYWVYEISKSFELGKNIIPVLFDGISLSTAMIPDLLKDLPRLNAVGYNHEYADAFYNKLISFLVKEKGAEKNTVIVNIKKKVEDSIPVIKEQVSDIGQQIAQTTQKTVKTLREKWKELTK